MSSLPTSTISHNSCPDNPGLVLDYLFENQTAPDLLRALSAMPAIDAEAQKSSCDKLAKCGLVEYAGDHLQITLLGKLVAEARQNGARRSPGDHIGLLPTTLQPQRANPFISFWRRFRRDIKATNSLEWVIVIGFIGLVAAGVYSAVFAPGKIEPLIFFQIASQALILIGTLYVASGVIYHPPTSEFSTVAEVQEHVTRVFSDASRHCKVGLILFIIGTIIDFAEKTKYLEHWLKNI